VPLSGAWAYLVDGRVAQVAIVDSQLPVEAVRALVESGAGVDEVGALSSASRA
jgi:hypothetical protein